jgi:Protein of unknown function (DUF2800)
MSDHARFAPSSAHRWLNCTGSVDAASRYPEVASEAGQEGSAAHFLLECCLVDGGNAVDHLGRTIRVSERGVTCEFVVTHDMARDVQLGVDVVREIVSHPGVSGVEARVDLSFISQDAFGTTDLWHWGQDGVLTIVDFKYGRGDVAVEMNDQLMIYAAGVFEAIRTLPLKLGMFEDTDRPRGQYLPARITLVIVQPRSVAPTPRVKTWTFDAKYVEHIVQRAFDAITAANRAPSFVEGPWCAHCPALGECPATNNHRDLALSLLTSDLTVADAERILRRKDLLEKIVERAEKELLKAMLDGYKSEYFPLVTKRKHRQWRDADLARQRVVDEIGPQVLVAPSPSETEKLGAAGKTIVVELSFTPPGEPVIGKPGDKRASFIPKSAETMFGPAQGSK